jgi:hypothetical protein
VANTDRLDKLPAVVAQLLPADRTANQDTKPSQPAEQGGTSVVFEPALVTDRVQPLLLGESVELTLGRRRRQPARKEHHAGEHHRTKGCRSDNPCDGNGSSPA